MTQPAITFDQVLARARQRFDGTDAEFDYSIATDTPIGLRSQIVDESGHIPTGDAMLEINNACHELANAHRPEVTPGGDNRLDEREAAGRALRAELAEQIEAYAAACRTRKFTGWSKYSTDEIRYADTEAGA